MFIFILWFEIEWFSTFQHFHSNSEHILNWQHEIFIWIDMDRYAAAIFTVRWNHHQHQMMTYIDCMMWIDHRFLIDCWHWRCRMKIAKMKSFPLFPLHSTFSEFTFSFIVNHQYIFITAFSWITAFKLMLFF